MVNYVTFLKNYNKFGHKIRPLTSKIYLENLLSSSDGTIKKIMMLRITEELILSTEDLVMWLMALESRNSLSKKHKDIWEYLLDCKADDLETIKTLKKISKIRTSVGFLRWFKLPNLKKMSEYLKTGEEGVLPFLNNLLKATRASLKSRTTKGRVLVRFHNKVKHGMMVQDYGNELFIRETKFETRKRKNGTEFTYRRNRNLYLPIDTERAKKMVESIESNSVAIQTTIWLLMADFVYNYLPKRKRKKLGSRQRRFLEDILNSG